MGQTATSTRRRKLASRKSKLSSPTVSVRRKGEEASSEGLERWNLQACLPRLRRTLETRGRKRKNGKTVKRAKRAAVMASDLCVDSNAKGGQWNQLTEKECPPPPQPPTLGSQLCFAICIAALGTCYASIR